MPRRVFINLHHYQIPEDLKPQVRRPSSIDSCPGSIETTRARMEVVIATEKDALVTDIPEQQFIDRVSMNHTVYRDVESACLLICID
jgi:hypothetical protein